MRRLFRKGMALVIASILLLMNTAVFAENGKTVNVKGYGDEWMTEEERMELFSVSNVVETLDTKDFDVAFVVKSPSTIKIIAEVAEVFFVHKLTPEGEIDYEQNLSISGPVSIAVPDPSGALDEYGHPVYLEKTIDSSELKNYEFVEPIYLQGCNVALTEPGEYSVFFRYDASTEGTASAYIKVMDTNTVVEKPVQKPIQSQLMAAPTSSKVLVNGTETFFDAYTIDGNNYFKLRDIAKVVSGTEKQFEVEWNNEIKAINLISNTTYTVLGGELERGNGQAKTAILNSSNIYKDGEEVQLTAYTINGNNYFKLRDLAEAFDIGVTWDNATKTIGIDTSIGYTPE